VNKGFVEGSGAVPEYPPAPARWDRETERRYSALELALRWSTSAGGGKSPSTVIEAAEEFFQFLSKTKQWRPEEIS
jgi:hypothetical protein